MKRLALSLLLLAWPVSAEPLPSDATKPAANRAPVVLPVQAAAEPQPTGTPEQQQAQRVVQTKLVQPLATKEESRSRFSRVLMPTPVMRVRVTDPQPQKDAQGAAFMTFAVDTCRGFHRKGDDCWQKAAITGCVYPTNGQVFVQRGDQFYPADIMLGKKGDSTSSVCHAQPPTRT